ncbi:MAG: ATP-binding protein [Desulfobacteraceae bacterium]|nr:ATP-binding protein [Desulfobacteraceae bacterium]
MDLTELARWYNGYFFGGEPVYYPYDILLFFDKDGQSKSKNPLAQIKGKRYFEKYMGDGKQIFLIGIEFSKEKRNLTGFEWEQIFIS